MTAFILLSVAHRFAPPGQKIPLSKALIGKVAPVAESKECYAGSLVELLTIGTVTVLESPEEIMAKLSRDVNPE